MAFLINVFGMILFLLAPTALLVYLLRCAWLEHRRDRVPILLYHRLISRADAQRGLVRDDEMIWVSYDTSFAEQMAHLVKEGYTTLDLDDYVRIRSGGEPMPAKPIIITFDDGYLSNYRFAFPVLRQHGQKATIFVAPEPDDYTQRIVQGVDGFLTADQMREMASQGISIQSHTLTHCVLTELADESVRHELEESRRRLEEATGRPVRHIAIPRAGYSRRIRRWVRKCGYQTACCNNKGTANGLSDVLALPRIVIERDMTIKEFAHSLTPRGALTLRLLGNIKRMPEFVGGSSFARRVRRRLYSSPLKPLFETRNLKRVLLAGAACYVIACVAFAYHLVTR